MVLGDWIITFSIISFLILAVWAKMEQTTILNLLKDIKENFGGGQEVLNDIRRA